ncbi:glycosyltransferase family A protein [Nocardioides sp.]|uniref:glycosyltransferase n=1 Tax=Nocardioides sp. TaxID=35761 RepID=UPI002CE2B271|nr:glycosyltransferase family A protein [Nocardioides sp.]HXH77166.1 glycosyltransferase family A protein [Nocardioides sp.]
MTLPRAVAVVIPARDEELLLPACLDSVEHAIGVLLVTHPSIRCRVFVVLDSCLDGTPEIVAARPPLEAVPVRVGQVGAARDAGLDAATKWSQATDPARVWIANTDADTVVPGHWLIEQMALAAAGHDLVVGTVQPEPTDLTRGELALWSERHTMPDGHEHVHGANLGFSLRAGHAVGGFPHVAVHEDVQLVRNLRESGAPWIASGGIRVVTSGRRCGRAPGGFATYLDGLTSPA